MPPQGGRPERVEGKLKCLPGEIRGQRDRKMATGGCPSCWSGSRRVIEAGLIHGADTTC